MTAVIDELVLAALLGLALAGLAFLRHRYRRLAQARAEELARLAAVVQYSGDAIITQSPDGAITSWNPGAERLYGYEAEEAMGRPISIIIPPDRGGEEQEIIDRARRGQPVEHRETRHLRKDGSTVDVSLSVATIRSSGDLESIAVVARDITARKRAEEALAKARDQAFEASRAKSRFLATMSHEIRTPMNGVIGLTGLLLDSDLDETQRHYAEGLRRAGEALLAVIDDVLDFSKIEAGRLELEAVDVRLDQVVDEVVERAAETARNKGVELAGYCDPDVPSVLRGDVHRVRQVLLSLVSNAVKFTEEGEVVVRARLAEDRGDRVVVRLEVVDTGVGIPSEDRDRVFHPFSQADGSTTRRHGGTGLGLAISRQLIEAMGGTIGVESEPGRGTTFWVTLPFERQAEGALRRQAPVAPAGKPRPRLGRRGASDRGGRILVAEDNDMNQMVALGMLGRLGYGADVVPTGAEAVQALSEGSYAAVLMDCHMPEMDGYEATAEIRRREGTDRHTPIIAMTASALPGDRDRCLEAGMDDYLAKPVKPEEVEEALSRWLGEEAGEEADLGVPEEPAYEVAGEGTLDHSRLEVLRQLGPDGHLLARMANAFLEQAPGRMDRLRASAECGDAPAVQQESHTLKGAAAQLGAVRMAAVCEEIETLGRHHDVGPARELLDRLGPEFERVREALRPMASPPAPVDHLGQGPPAPAKGA